MLYVLHELFPFNASKRMPFPTQFNENNIKYFHVLFKILLLQKLYALKLFTDFYKVKISTNYEKSIHKLVLSISATPSTVVREITRTKGIKTYNFRFRWGMCNRLIVRNCI